MEKIDWEKVFSELEFRVLEQRDGARHEVQIRVAWVFEGAQYQGTSGDLSAGGLFIASQDILPEGIEFKLAFMLPTCAEPIRAVGRVAWVRAEAGEGPEERRGFGVELLKMSREDLTNVEQFLQLREALLLDDPDV